MKKFLILVVLHFLRLAAKIQLLKNKPLVIGVTGSAGKSSTVAAIETALKQKYQVKSTGTTNSESGIPLSILGLKMTDYSPFDWLRVILLIPVQLLFYRPSYTIFVAEMGIDSLKPPKNMGYLLSIIKPQIGVFLNVLPVHTEQMRNVDAIAVEKGKLIASLPTNGFAIVNKNDPRTQIKTAAKTVLFDGTALGAANTIGKILGVPPIKSFTPPPGRGQVFAGINNSKLIDSSYNASGIPMLLALAHLAKRRAIRRIAVLGDMRELGDLAASEHKIVAKEAYRLADKIITVGPLTEIYFPKDPKLVAQFANSWQAGKFLQTYIKSGDVVLFKGSQNTIFLETAVEMCLKNRADATKLCRRGKFWDKQREKYAKEN
ncbi:hypothetical protein HY440_03305 [Candidatus Microgenomates bacterium]|nr:hypothetical protein [Candidatus Microgenomates bacterium]